MSRHEGMCNSRLILFVGGSKIIDTTLVKICERFCALTIKERTPDIHTNIHIYHIICIRIYW